MIEIPINNDFQGLFDYFTAPNIRHKVRHPIFLAIKFSNCVKFYYNSLRFKSPNVFLMKFYYQKLREILGELQFALDNRGKEVMETEKLNNIAILRIIIPDISQIEGAKKITDGIGLPDPPNTPLRIFLSTEPLPDGFAQVTNIVLLF